MYPPTPGNRLVLAGLVLTTAGCVANYDMMGNYHETLWYWIYYTLHTTELLGGILVSLRPSRHYKKSLLRSQIYHGYEELSTDTNYPIWRRQERRSKYAVQLASWQLRSNSPKTSVRLSVRPTSCVRSVAPTVLVGSISYLYILISNFRRCVTCKVSCKIWIFGSFLKFVTLTLSSFEFWLGIWCESLHG